jgi:hypothetical protein
MKQLETGQLLLIKSIWHMTCAVCKKMPKYIVRNKTVSTNQKY